MSGRRAIAFVGFMGAGKSRAARAAGTVLGVDPIDTDRVIEAELGEPLHSYFEREGEAAFRAVEERVVLDALAGGGVIALGGGAIESPAVREALTGHVVAHCRVSEGVAWERVSHTPRPLAKDRGAFRARYDARLSIYESISNAILPRGGDETGAAAAPWLAAMRSLPGVRMFWARTASGEYPALIGPGATEALEADGAPRMGTRLFAIADRGALAAQPGLLPEHHDSAIEIAGGEEAKTIAVVESTLRRLASAGVRRDDALVAFGGGVVGDLAGFCAAIYQRGIPVIQIPTTLVALVDSAYGGKTGVDLPEAKNYVGAYHQPAAVLADPSALATLPREELAAGYAEVVKTALIAGGELWELVRSAGPPTPDSLHEVIFRCALTKLSVVAEDERDAGRRAVLNLGHTVGHAIETATSYSRYRHGEAVGLGLLASLRLSDAGELRDQVSTLLEEAGLPTSLDAAVDTERVLEAVAMDKKQTAKGLDFVLIRKPGVVVHGQRVDEAALKAAIEELRAV